MMYKQFEELCGIDISKEKMEVAPTAHYSMEGIRTNETGGTKIKGLFAVGEAVGQVHGANRLGGNSLLETIVYGKIVGRAAAATATTTATDTTSIITRFPHDSSKLKDDLLQSQSSNKNDGNEMKVIEKILHELYSVKNATEVQQEIRQLMRENAGIVKERNRPINALNRLMELKRVLLQ